MPLCYHSDIYHNAPKGSAWDLFMQRLKSGRCMKIWGRLNSVWSQLQRALPKEAGVLLPRLDIVHLDRNGGTVRVMHNDASYDFWETDEQIPAYDNPINDEERKQTVNKVKFIPSE